ncbi:MAG: WYL domain-containing transcriptional regulator [Ruminococcaceae bacterium]|jgi:predicted DNA-binding transcriptional regulator YafY|nr:WYL domain-containing transcriptional regulator [Oscillospiraceae bacterium]
MAGNANQKLKLLYLADILKHETNEENVLSAIDITKRLADYGISSERKSIYSDIEILKDYGFDIISTRSPKYGYFLASGDFEPHEVRLLMDAVQAAGFISNKKTKQLIEKISGLTNSFDAKKLLEQVYVDSRQKSSNEEVYYSIDKINKAICQGNQITLTYIKRVVNDNKTVSFSEKKHTVNPYALIWSNDHYYLISNNVKYDNLMPLRIDRMKKVTIIEGSTIRPLKEVSDYSGSFDSADYVSKHMNMFTGQAKPVELICDNSIIEQILDKFGERTPIYPNDENTFVAKFSSAITDGLVSWILQYGNLIKVSSPRELKTLVINTAKSVIDNYE